MASASSASSSGDGCISSHLNPSIVEKLEAGAFRELCRHLQERSDSVQNMDLMTLSGFCRNCLAKWMVLEARRLVDKQITERLDASTIQALNAMGYEEAAQHVYGMTYNDYKARYQKKATDEQMERYNASSHLHAQHDKALLDTRSGTVADSKPKSSLPTPTTTTKTTTKSTPVPTAVTPSSVCCENVEQVAAAAAAAAARHDSKTTTTTTPDKAVMNKGVLPPYQPAPMMPPTKLLFSSMKTLCIGVLTVSDRAHQKEYVTGDLSGPAVVREIQQLFQTQAAEQQEQQQSSTTLPLPIVFVTSVVPDEVNAIQQQIKAWCGGGAGGDSTSSSNNSMDLIFTTGGTGFSRRDVTPEATRPLLHQECATLMSFCAMECSKIQPLASLSRGTAGIILHQEPKPKTQQPYAATSATSTMIANLPGNPQAIAEIMPLLLPLLLHALCDLRGMNVVHS